MQWHQSCHNTMHHQKNSIIRTALSMLILSSGLQAARTRAQGWSHWLVQRGAAERGMCLQAALQHFQTLLDGEPQLAGQIGNEQIKTRAASQVLWVSPLHQAGYPDTLGPGLGK